MKQTSANLGLTIAVSLAACVAHADISQPAFTPGYLAVLQESDGGPGRCLPVGVTTGITNYSASDLAASRQNQIFIDQFNPNGINQTSPSVRVAIPTNGPGAMMVNGNAGTEGNLTLSGDKSVLAFAGYAGDILSITTGGQTAPSNLSYDRGICTVDAFTNYTQVYKGGGWYGIATGKTNPRGVATDGAGNFWGCGNGYGSLYYSIANGGPLQFQNVALTSASKVINNTLYASVKASEAVNLYPAGVYSFVDFNNNPVAYPSSISYLHLEIPATAPYTTCIGFDINPQNNIAYVADTTFGIQKYIKSGLTWKLAYNLSIPGYFGLNNGIMTNSSGNNIAISAGNTNVLVGCFSVTVDWSGTNPVVYATTTDSGVNTSTTYYGNRVIRINDTNTLVNGANLIATTNYLTTVVRPPIVNGLQITNIAFKSVTFTPDVRPAITNQPVSWSAAAGDNVAFNVGAFSSTPGLAYQWLQNGTNLDGQTTDTLALNAVDLSLNGYQYQCVVNNNYGSVTSSIAILTVSSTPIPPVIGAVQNLTNYLGNNQSITVSVSGTDPKGGYAWYFNGDALSDAGEYSGTATSTLNISGISLADSGVYSVVVTNIAGSASNVVANFTGIYSAPALVQAPISITTFAGAAATNNASAFGAALLEQWYSALGIVYTNTSVLTVVSTNSVGGVNTVQTSSKTTSSVGTGPSYVTNALTDGASYSGTTSTTLSLLNPQLVDSFGFVLAKSLVTNVTTTTKFTTNTALTTVTNTLTTTTSVIVISNNLGNFSIVFSNPGGSVTSSPAPLFVLNARRTRLFPTPRPPPLHAGL